MLFVETFFRQNTIRRKMLQRNSRENILMIFIFILVFLLHTPLLLAFNTRLKLILVLLQCELYKTQCRPNSSSEEKRVYAHFTSLPPLPLSHFQFTLSNGEKGIIVAILIYVTKYLSHFPLKFKASEIKKSNNFLLKLFDL